MEKRRGSCIYSIHSSFDQIHIGKDRQNVEKNPVFPQKEHKTRHLIWGLSPSFSTANL